MDYALDKIKRHIIDLINQAEPLVKAEFSDLSFPPNQEMGDLSLPCFNLAKMVNSSPVKFAEKLLCIIKTDKIISGVKTAGPYLNFTLNKKYLAEEVFADVFSAAEKYGHNQSGDGKKVMVEYANVNTHKEFHIGHLRNISYGDAVYKILNANGFKVVPLSYVNDFGIHVAKTLWNFPDYIKEHHADTWEKMNDEEKGAILGKIYANACQREKESPVAKQMIGGIMGQIEKRKGKEYELWQESRKWSIKSFAAIYKELKIKFKDTWYENEFFEAGIKKVNQLLADGVFKKSEGAIIAELEEYNLGVLPIIRSDGSALYPVADLALAEYKFKKYKSDISVYVVDNRQSLYFQQLFKILELLGFKQKMIHLGFDFVKLPTGAMSSRSGNVITYQKLSKKVFKKAADETVSRHRDWSPKKIKKISQIIGIGAMKFEMIKVGADKVIIFDIEKSLSFEGFTAAYLQYTYARISSVARRAGSSFQFKKISFDKLSEFKEHELLIKIIKYPEVVAEAGKKYSPSLLAKYLFELAQEFNDFYHQENILQSEKRTREARLALSLATANIIKNGLGLLGIETTEEM